MTDLLSAFAAEWPIFIALSITGIFAGILAGLLGVGGGIVIVPVLYFLLPQFGVSPDSAMMVATATSLATIIPTSLSSIRSHAQKGNIDWRIVKIWAVFIALAATAGTLFAPSLKGSGLTAMFGIIAMLVSLNMLFRAGAKPLCKALPAKPIQAIFASLVGGLSVMIGIGGGTLGVPVLNALSLTAHRAVGTAAVFGLVIAVTGVITVIMTGTSPVDAPIGTWRLINIPAFIAIFPLTVLFAPVGVKIGAALNQAQLKKCFAVVLFITGGRMLYQVVGG